MSFYDRWNSGAINNGATGGFMGNQLQDLGQKTAYAVRAQLQATLTEQCANNAAAMHIYNECRTNGARFESLYEATMWTLHFMINTGKVDSNSSNDMIVADVCLQAVLTRQIKLLEKDEQLRMTVANTTNDVFQNFVKIRGHLLGFAQQVGQWTAQMQANGMSYSGFVGNQPAQAAQPAQQQYSQPQRLRPLSGAPNGWGQGVAGTEEIFRQGNAPVHSRQAAELASKFDYDEDDVIDINPQPAPVSRRQQEPVRQPEPRYQERSDNGMQDVYNLAERFAVEEEDPLWDPLDVHVEQQEPAVRQSAPYSHDAEKYGPVVRHDEYILIRNKATKFNRDQPWPISYDATQFARRAYVDNTGLLHETIVPLSTLTEKEMDYTQLETDPEARRQAELNQLHLNALAEREPLVVSSTRPAPSDVAISVGEERDVELVIVKELMNSTSEEQAEGRASAIAIAQTEKDINQSDAIAYASVITKHLGVYSDIDSFREFLEAFDVSTMGRDVMPAVAKMLQDWKGRVPDRIWHAIDKSATAEVNMWIRRIMPSSDPITIDSFAEDMNELIVVLRSEGMDKDWLSHSLQQTGTEWLRALKCLHSSPDGIGHYHLRNDIAFLFDRQGYVDASEHHVNKIEAQRIAEHDRIHQELKEDDSLTDEERELRLKEAMKEFIENEREVPLSEDSSTDVWWMNHSVFMQTVHIALRVPSTVRDLALNQNGFTHASAATNPAIANLLIRTFDAFEDQVVGLRRVTVFLSDGTRLNAIRTNAAQTAQEFLLERVG